MLPRFAYRVRVYALKPLIIFFTFYELSFRIHCLHAQRSCLFVSSRRSRYQPNSWRVSTFCLSLHGVLSYVRSYAASRATSTVWVKKIPPWGFVAIFPKRLGIFGPNFTCLLRVPIYAILRISVQLSATLTKLCHIKHNATTIMCSKSTETHAGWSHLIWHNFVTVGDKWIKICTLA